MLKPDPTIPLYYNWKTKRFTKSITNDLTFPVVLFPIFHFRKGFILLSEKLTEHSPFIPVRLVDLYYYYLFSNRRELVFHAGFDDYLRNLVYSPKTGHFFITNLFFQALVFKYLAKVYKQLECFEHSSQGLSRFQYRELKKLIFHLRYSFNPLNVSLDAWPLVRVRDDTGRLVTCQIFCSFVDRSLESSSYGLSRFLLLAVECFPECFRIYDKRHSLQKFQSKYYLRKITVCRFTNLFSFAEGALVLNLRISVYIENIGRTRRLQRKNHDGSTFGCRAVFQ